MIEYSQYTAKEFLDILCSILPQEIDKWQAEVIFKNVSIDIKNGIVTINLEKGSPAFIKSKYENYLQYMFPKKKYFTKNFKRSTVLKTLKHGVVCLKNGKINSVTNYITISQKSVI